MPVPHQQNAYYMQAPTVSHQHVMGTPQHGPPHVQQHFAVPALPRDASNVLGARQLNLTDKMKRAWPCVVFDTERYVRADMMPWRGPDTPQRPLSGMNALIPYHISRLRKASLKHTTWCRQRITSSLPCTPSHRRPSSIAGGCPPGFRLPPLPMCRQCELFRRRRRPRWLPTMRS